MELASGGVQNCPAWEVTAHAGRAQPPRTRVHRLQACKGDSARAARRRPTIAASEIRRSMCAGEAGGPRANRAPASKMRRGRRFVQANGHRRCRLPGSPFPVPCRADHRHQPSLRRRPLGRRAAPVPPRRPAAGVPRGGRRERALARGVDFSLYSAELNRRQLSPPPHGGRDRLLREPPVGLAPVPRLRRSGTSRSSKTTSTSTPTWRKCSRRSSALAARGDLVKLIGRRHEKVRERHAAPARAARSIRYRRVPSLTGAYVAQPPRRRRSCVAASPAVRPPGRRRHALLVGMRPRRGRRASLTRCAVAANSRWSTIPDRDAAGTRCAAAGPSCGCRRATRS